MDEADRKIDYITSMYVDTWLQLSYDIANIQNPGPKLAATTASAFLRLGFFKREAV